mgnify:FL=1
MNKILTVTLLLVTAVFTLELIQESTAHLAGGLQEQSLLTATPGFSVVGTYVLSQHPELATATVTKLSTQVVAGTNYYITYETNTTRYDVVVWEKTWENFISITSFTSTTK